MSTFGWSFLQFARSVQNLTQENTDTIKELVAQYFLDPNGLDACYFCVHRSGGMFENEPVFKTVWSSNPESEAHFVKRFVDGEINKSPSLRALAYN